MPNLHYLDLENNRLTDLEALESLTHLRYLHVNANHITDLTALDSLDSLLRFEARENRLQTIDFTSSGLYALVLIDVKMLIK